jgi:uncharacterized protein YbjT (DUF2867 family)
MTLKGGGLKVVMLGATGAVGQECLKTLQAMPEIGSVTALVRRPFTPEGVSKLSPRVVDVFDPSDYARHLEGHHAAICTFGVGEPSKVSLEEFRRVDFDAVLAFAAACRGAGVQHFELLGSVAADPVARNSYLRSKGALREAIAALGFQRFSCFQPSMILTPENRYGLAQGVLLKLWPIVSPLLVGGLSKYRGVYVAQLGAAMARTLTRPGQGAAILHWRDFQV